MIKASANPQKPLSLFQNFIEQGVECRILTHNGLHNLAVRTYNNLGWETLDSILVEHIATLWIIDVNPWQLMLLYGSLPLSLGIIAVNTQDFELTLILLVVLLHLRHTLDTPDTPGTPEVDDNILATKAGKREWLAVDIIQSK